MILVAPLGAPLRYTHGRCPAASKLNTPRKHANHPKTDAFAVFFLKCSAKEKECFHGSSSGGSKELVLLLHWLSGAAGVRASVPAPSPHVCIPGKEHRDEMCNLVNPASRLQRGSVRRMTQTCPFEGGVYDQR